MAAAKIHPRNRPRVVRALEVLAATGRPLSSFWGTAGRARVPGPVVVLTRPRARLYARIDARVDAMFDAGWLPEVERLLESGLDATWPAYRSLGVPEVVAALEGRLTRAEAIERIQGATRRFARRQLTWLKGRHADAFQVDMDAGVDAVALVGDALQHAPRLPVEIEP